MSMATPALVVVSGGFDDLRTRDLRFLHEASKLGNVTVLLWPDALLEKITGKPPQLPWAERAYLLGAIRYVTRLAPADPTLVPDALPANFRADIWADYVPTANSQREAFCRARRLQYHWVPEATLRSFPPPCPPLAPEPIDAAAISDPSPDAGGREVVQAPAQRKKVIATGCFDWFHSGHVRFFEEASTYGDLYVVVGHDENIRLLKGPAHPLLSQEERRYAVGSVKYVHQALISSGEGWLDADPEIRWLKPDIYVVNEDGDKGGKREYCARLGLEYIVLKRDPAPGLPRRRSTDLRGF